MSDTAYMLILGAAAICAIFFGYIGYQTGLKRDSYIAGNVKGNLESDIAYIKRRSDDMLLEQKDTNKSLNALAERVTRVEESTKSAHKRIDQIEQIEKERGEK